MATGLAAAVIAALDSIFPGTPSLLGFAAVIALGIWFLVRIIVSTVLLIRRRWRKAVVKFGSTLIGAVLSALLLTTGDYIHLALYYPYYANEIRSRVDGKGPMRFEWGDDAIMVTDGIRLRTLVYDESDEMLGRANDRNEGLVLHTRRLFGHFYLQLESSP